MNVVTCGLAVTYIRSTGEDAPATIIGCSTHGEDFIHLKNMRDGHEIEHHAPFDRVLFLIRSPSPSPGCRDMLSFGTAVHTVAPPGLSTRTKRRRRQEPKWVALGLSPMRSEVPSSSANASEQLLSIPSETTSPEES